MPGVDSRAAGIVGAAFATKPSAQREHGAPVEE
jgi:hypothetical protein